MVFLGKRGFLLLAICALALPASADEIRLKDGKKLYGVIVAYEDNMFKVKTDFGFVLVEKDKIASIVPTASTTAAAKPDSKPATKKEPASAAESKTEPSITPVVEKTDKSPAKVTDAAAKPEVSSNTAKPNPPAPISKTSPPAVAPAPPPQEEPPVPVNREEIQGNLYTNYTHGFRMYKAPSWSPIDDARSALPNAIVAMGTSNESTLMVVGQEKTKEALDAAAKTVEARLHDVYENYQLISRRKTLVGGSPAIEFHYRGTADEHMWSGTLVVIARGNDVFTVLGMTYADSDLIQIQENVIARAIASLDFNVH